MTTTTTWELGALTNDGSWEHIGDYATRDEAEAAAVANGDGTYGLTNDPDGGRYEHAFEVDDAEVRYTR